MVCNESLALGGAHCLTLGNQVPQGARRRLRITSILEVTRELRLTIFFLSKVHACPKWIFKEFADLQRCIILQHCILQTLLFKGL